PLQNATRFVTHSNAKVIRRQMAQALSKINSMKNRPFNLDAFLNVAIPFTERYANFFVINCMAEEKELADSFCGFVEWRMRLQIIFDIDKKGGSIETHLNPNVYRETCDLPSKLVQMTVFRPIFCKVWLLAIVNDSVMPE
uniref:PDEase domain-containing protein n=1 Tax=Globodera pallida TaxID=36090 RepID=A0A183CT51_GLOPA